MTPLWQVVCAVYGGALLGAWVYWWRTRRSWLVLGLMALGVVAVEVVDLLRADGCLSHGNIYRSCMDWTRLKARPERQAPPPPPVRR